MVSHMTQARLVLETLTIASGWHWWLISPWKSHSFVLLPAAECLAVAFAFQPSVIRGNWATTCCVDEENEIGSLLDCQNLVRHKSRKGCGALSFGINTWSYTI